MVTVATLNVKVTASATELDKTLSGVEKKWGRIGSKLQSVGGNLTTTLTLPIVAFGGAAIKAAMDFESAMTKVQTLAGESAGNVKNLRAQVLSLATSVGIGPVALAEGLLAIESTGFRGAAAMDILEMSAKASAIGMGDTSDVARALTAAVNAYGAENLTAARAADILTATVDAGGAEADQLAGELGRVVGVAAQLGVSFEQVGAFIATYTKLGLSAAEATTGLSGVLNMILSPSREARNALADIGMSAEGLRRAVKEQGLEVALIGLLDKVKGNGDAVGALFGNVRALAGVMGTAGSQAATYRNVLDQIGDSTGTLNERFNIWKTTTAATWAQFKAGAQVAAIEIGDRLAPTFVTLLKAAKPVLDSIITLIQWFGKLPEPVQTAAIAVVALTAATGPVVYAIGSLMQAGAGIAGMFVKFGGSAAAAKLGITGLAGGVTAFTGALALIVVPLALERVYTLIANIVGLMNDQSNWKAGAAGDAATHDRMLQEASKVAGRQVTDVAEGQDILRAHNFALQQKALASKGAGFKLETDVTKLMGGATATAAAGAAKPSPGGAPRAKFAGTRLDTANLVLDWQREVIDNELEFAKAMNAVEKAAFDKRSVLNVDLLKDFGDEQRVLIDNENEFHRAVSEAFPDSVLDVSKLETYGNEQLQMIDNEYAFAQALDEVGRKDAELRARQVEGIRSLASAFGSLGAAIGGGAGSAIGSAGGILDAFAGFQQNGGPQSALGKVAAMGEAAAAIWASTQAGGGKGSNILGGAASGAMTGMAFGPWGAAVGAGVGALVGFVKSRMVSQEEKDARKEALLFQDQLIQKLFEAGNAASIAEAQGERWRMVNIAVRDAYLAIGRSEAEAMRDLERFNDATHVSAEAVQAAAGVIGAAFDEYAADQERLNNAIQRYGFEWEELGKKFQQTTLNNQAKDLIEDWRVLVGSGIEMSTVNTRMADAMNAYLQSALTAGVEVPLAMQPILQSFADQGLLVDAAGNKIADLSAAGVMFSETMSQGFDRIILKLDQLINSLIAAGTAIDPVNGGLVSQAGGGTPAPQQQPGTYRDWVVYFESLDGRASVQDMIQAAKNARDGLPIPAMASGGIVRRPTVALIGEDGPEAVVPLDGRSGGLGGDIHIHGDVYGWDDFAEKVAQGYHAKIEQGGTNRSRARQLGLVN